MLERFRKDGRKLLKLRGVFIRMAREYITKENGIFDMSDVFEKRFALGKNFKEKTFAHFTFTDGSSYIRGNSKYLEEIQGKWPGESEIVQKCIMVGNLLLPDPEDLENYRLRVEGIKETMCILCEDKKYVELIAYRAKEAIPGGMDLAFYSRSILG